jgi:catechol 2,3-dioxygenase-like lactoylglutathione lyase family enzyme
MKLDGIHHVAFLTSDMDRLISFYERIFEARVTLDLEEEGLRHVFIEVGPHRGGTEHVAAPVRGPRYRGPERTADVPPRPPRPFRLQRL